MPRPLRLITRVLCVAMAMSCQRASSDDVDARHFFDQQVAAIFSQRCLTCHDRNSAKGQLDLSHRAGLLAGGESGVPLVAGVLDESLLWQRVNSDEMPPEHPLTAEEKMVLKQWIERGADWGSDPIDRFRFSTESRAGYDWWSLQPLRRPSVPNAPAGTEWDMFPAYNAIDRFIHLGLANINLRPSPAADRRTLIRRLCFDLTGLPPTPERIDQFLQDQSPLAYEKLVDELLASPHYAERWTRHWLDVARYGESDGFEYDKHRPNAWRYRDWVLQAFNSDLAYNQFAALQIAGDILDPANPEAVTAVGFLVCGAHDSLLPQGDIQRAIMRQDEMEDLVGAVCQTFLGLTVNCARCHDHKFDPIHQADYYRVSAALGGVRRGDRSIASPEMIAEIDDQIQQLRQALEAIERPARERILTQRATSQALPQPPKARLQWEFAVAGTGQADGAGAPPEITTIGGAVMTPQGLRVDGDTGYARTGPLDFPVGERTLTARVLLDNLDQRGGAAISIQTLDGQVFDAIVFGEREAQSWMAGSDGFGRTQSFAGPAEQTAIKHPVHFAITYQADGTIAGYRNGELYGRPYKSGFQTYDADLSEIVFGLRHGTSAGPGRMLSGTIVEAAIYDRVLTQPEVAAAAGIASDFISPEELENALSPSDRSARATLVQSMTRLAAERESCVQRQAYTVMPTEPGVTHLLARGNPAQPLQPVAPGGVSALAGVRFDFEIPADAPDELRRRKLANWLTAADNPLFARTMVNRMWQYHFGQAIVTTPNDLGYSGGRPSHPELLDWLASTFRDANWSIKHLHRIIVTSATYRQQSLPTTEGLARDAENRLLWRMTPRRLEAEVVRDAMLAASGALNTAIGGEAYRDWNMHNHKSTWNYDAIDPEGFAEHRRTLYRSWARGGRNPLLDTFDCPDPSSTTPTRGVTTTPLQALALLNNSFALRMSSHFAATLEMTCPPDTTSRVQEAFRRAYGREPQPEESARAAAMVEQHGLVTLCRVLFNSNEFLYVP